MTHTILLYYKYVAVEDPKQLMREQRALCERRGLTGRIIVAHEGINGTLEGLTENTEAYIDAMRADARFADTAFKKSEGTGAAFPRLSVKVRNEIVSAGLGEDDVNPNELTGIHLDSTELDQWYDQGKEFVVVDMRNDYELDVGCFKNTVMPGLRSFHELSLAVSKLDEYKDKTVVTACTGGVRCEKASGYLLKKGFKDVYQLDGGMATYMERHPGKHFRGKLYVFDQRVVMGDGSNTPDSTIGMCRRCNESCERYLNCGNEDCHIHFICCDNCLRTDGKAFCSDHCQDHGRVLAKNLDSVARGE